MGIIQKKSGNKAYGMDVECTNCLEQEIRDCMKCRYFWGNSSRCIAEKCYTERMKEPVHEEKKDKECEMCPYRQQIDYCFPCMKEILERKTENTHKKLEPLNDETDNLETEMEEDYG